MGKKKLALFFVVLFLVFSSLLAALLLFKNAGSGSIKEIAPGRFLFQEGNNRIEVQNSTSAPYATLDRWGGEVSVKVKYQPQAELTPKTEGNKLKLKGEKEELHFYTISDSLQSDIRQQQFFAGKLDFLKRLIPHSTTSVLANHEKLRYVKLGELDPESMAASYEMFQRKTDQAPTLLAYTPKKDTFVFFGYKEEDRDLYKDKIALPITRYKTADDNQACPVIYASAQDTLVFTYYNPGVSKEPKEYFNLALGSINNALAKYDVQINAFNHALYYQDGLLPKQVGRMTTDGDYVIFYLYLNSPLKQKQFITATRPHLALRDGAIVPIGGLREKNQEINHSLVDEVATAFASTIGSQLVSETLSTEESQIMKDLAPKLVSDAWKQLGHRDDISSKKSQADKFEIELILKEKPQTNAFHFAIESEGLNFYYQPELTEEQKDNGEYRPENIIGSYAVYYAAQEKIAKTKEEGEKYLAGKAFHIYRPWIYDNNGKGIWGTMHYDETSKLLTVTVPEEFLANATYPVSVDPTFGYETIGGTSTTFDASARNMNGSVFTMGSAAGTGTSMTAYLQPDDKLGVIDVNKYGLYKSSNSTFVTNGATQEFTGFSAIADPAAWITANFSTAPTLEASTNYILVFWSGADSSDVTYKMFYDAGTTNQGKYTQSAYAASFPATPSFSSEDRKYSIYVTYNLADSTGPVISAITPSPSATSVIITWTTDEAASSKVDYGLTTSYGSTTTETDTSPRVTSHSVTLSSLACATLYHFRVRSIDGNANETIGSDNTFTTTACGDTSPVSTPSINTTPACGKTVGVKAPLLYGAIAQDANSILLYFTPIDEPVDRYALKYGTKSNEYIYGINDMGVDSQNQMTFLVQSLSPGTTYFFRVRGGNGCATGQWSDEISATTKRQGGAVQLPFVPSLLKELQEPQEPQQTQIEEQVLEKVYTLTIKVVDTAKKPVAGAKVEIHSEVQEKLTDKNGIAEFTNVKGGEHKVLIAYNNYQGEQVINVTGEDEDIALQLEIKPQNVVLSPTFIGAVGFLAAIIAFLSWKLVKNK